MDNHRGHSLTEEIAALRDWWQVAGVDHLFLDEPQGLLSEPVAEVASANPAPAKHARSPARAPLAEPPVAEPAVTLGPLPETLEEFREWWVDPQRPFPAVGPRIAPEGAAGAPLLILVPMPETGDAETLLSGPQGRLLGNIARALGIDPAACYRAAALPTALDMPDWAELGRMGLAEVMRHHLALARPQRVLLFGSDLAQLLAVPRNATGHRIALAQGELSVLATHEPDLLLAHPRRRARLWQALLDWTAP